jgi:acyl-coenzyme A synthetase/AMP-(fatty) acid ligase
MTRLQECLVLRDRDDVLWITSEAGSVTVGACIESIKSKQRNGWYNKRVAIGNISNLEYLFTLVFLDGVVSELLILPNDIDDRLRDDWLMQLDIDVLIEGDGLGLSSFVESSISDTPASIVDCSVPSMSKTIWYLPTSGTTDSPKLVPHNFDSLTRSIGVRSVVYDYTWISFYNIRRFAGLQVFLQAWMCSCPLILADELTTHDSLLQMMKRHNCNAASATPSMWRHLSMYPGFGDLNLKQITLGGEIADQSILDALSARFPHSKITHIYASTEAGVGFAVHDRKAGFPTSFLTLPPRGVSMKVDDNGHLWVESSFTRLDDERSSCDWVDSGDVVSVVGDRVLFEGRANGCINVGGYKVMPEEVESVIRELPQVINVQVRARMSSLLGNLVEALVVTTADTLFDSEFKKLVVRHCQSKLESYKVPAFVINVDMISLTSSGKISRR